MAELVRRLDWTRLGRDETERLLTREWLVTNGLGGYASGTVAGVVTRRYHGLLVAALPAPLGRTMMLNHAAEAFRLPDRRYVDVGGEERLGELTLHDGRLADFRLEMGLPVWRFDLGGARVEKRVLMPHGQNTVHVAYRLVDGEPVRLRLRPALHVRPHDAPVGALEEAGYVVTAAGDRYEIHPGENLPVLRLRLHGAGASFTLETRWMREVLYRVERSRGYDARGDLWSPGYFRAELAPGAEATLIASTEAWETVDAFAPTAARAAELERRQRLLAAAGPAAADGVAGELVLAADQFMITPAGRREEEARARAAGDEARTVIAGYHWFTDWGRDTMIALEGLTLVTGRRPEAAWILRTFAHHVRDGLIPNYFPEGERGGVYHTADATLWFFHAIDRYVRVTGDRLVLDHLLPTLVAIGDHHRQGTRFGIGVDPGDGLLRQGDPDLPLTWMDARVNGWVVTPRRGKAVEINALWYNALRLLEGWLAGAGDARAREVGREADRVARSFDARFWYATGGYLYDVVDGEAGDDAACRPNQILAIALPHPVLDPARWKSVVEVVRERLLTPVGLRSLAPGHPDYKARYWGDLRSRDAAYHQGTVWAWLLGPFVDAWLRVHPEDRAGARRLLEGLVPHLDDGCVGSLSEIFDAEPPFAPRGCVAQAWSVAEALRAWVLTASPAGHRGAA